MGGINLYLRKFILSLLVVATLVSTSAGCGGNVKNNDSSKSSVKANSSESLSDSSEDSLSSIVESLSESTTEAKTDSQTSKVSSKTSVTSSRRSAASTVSAAGDNKNMQGYEFVLGTIWGGSWIPSDNSSSDVKALADVYKGIEKELNCKITLKALTPSTLTTQVAKAYQAGAKFADAVELSPYYFYNMVQNNFFIPVSDSPVINIKDEKWIESSKAFSTYNGKVYGLSWTTKILTSSARIGLFFNKTMMSQFGMGDLYQVVKDKKWTFSKFEETLGTVAEKSGGNVKGLAAYDLISIGQYFANANAGGFVSEKGGKYSFVGASNETVNGIEAVRKWYKNGWIRDTGKDSFTNVVVKEFVDGKVFSIIADYYYANRFFKSKMKQDYGILPLPMGPAAKQYYGIYDEGRFFALMDTADRDKCVTIFNKLSDKTWMKDWKSNALKNDLRDSESVDMVEINMNNPKICLLTQLSALKYNVVGGAIEKSIKQGSTAGNMSGVLTQSQTWLNDMFQQK